MKLITQSQFNKAKIVALFVFTIFFTKTDAKTTHHQGSSLRLLLPYQTEHKIIIDNMPYTGVYNNFKIDNLYGGNHRLKIIQFIFSRNGRLLERRIIFNNIVFIPNNSKVWATITQNGRFVIEKTLFKRNQQNNRSYTNENNYDSDDYSDNDIQNYNDNWDERDANSNNNNKGNSRNNSNTGQRNNELTSFELTLNALKKQSFDTERLKIAKNAVVNGEMLSKEILEITKLFSFESTKIEFAKYAYGYTIDKKNYVLVQDAFQFNSSTSELQEYIANYRH